MSACPINCLRAGRLSFREFLAAWNTTKPGTSLPVDRVVFVATPHLGSADAVESLIRGVTVIFGGQKDLRKLARTLPAKFPEHDH